MQGTNGVLVEIRCLPVNLHPVFMVGLTIDGDLSILHCQRFFVDRDFLIRDTYLVVVEAIFIDSYQVRELRLDNYPVGVLALLEFISHHKIIVEH